MRTDVNSIRFDSFDFVAKERAGKGRSMESNSGAEKLR